MMPEELIPHGVGYKFFGGERGPFIANENAVLQTFETLSNHIVNETAFDHLGQAREAVQAATRRKFDIPDDPNDNPDQSAFMDGDDFWF